MRDFRELKVWEKAHSLTLQVYRELNQQVNEVKRMLNSFIQKLTTNG